MKATEFCYWLQGWLEISPSTESLSVDQVEIIRKHLNLVFIHEIDPSYPKEQQPALNAAHSGGKVLMRC